MSDDASRTVLEAIKEGFSQSRSSFDKINDEISKISEALNQLNIEIQVLKGNVAAVENSTTEARDDLKQLEAKVVELERKASALSIAVEIAKSATPRHLPERVAIIENSMASIKKFGWIAMTGVTGLVIKAIWDLMKVGA
jgi:septation ring formation regulator EzrA